jgi:hypothetical protein
MSKIDTFIKLAGKFKSDLRQQYKDSMSYPDAGEIADIKRRGGDSPRDSINNAFNYIERSKNPEQARNRAEEMFGEFDIDGAIEEAGGFEKAFKETPIKGVTQARQKMMTPAQKRRARKTQKESGLSARRDMKDAKPPIEKAKGGLATSRSRKPRGVGVALRGYGKALK